MLIGEPVILGDADQRPQTCISTLAVRHLAVGGGPITRLNDLRAPMTDVLKIFATQLAELQQYKARYGRIDAPGPVGRVLEDVSDMSSDTGSDTEQE